MTRKLARVRKHKTPCGCIDYVVEILTEEGWAMTEDEYPTKEGANRAMKRWEK